MRDVSKIIILALCLGLTFSLSGDSKKDPPDNDQKEQKKINNIIVDTQKKEIRLRCKLAITSGILEFFLVTESGRTYESVLKIAENKPSELHFALLLLGFEPLPFPEYSEILKNLKKADLNKYKKSLLKIRLLHKDKAVSLPSILKYREADDIGNLQWVFTGTPFSKDNKYMGDYSDIFISIWPDETGVINLLSQAGNPYRGDFGYEVKSDSDFSVDDNFEVIITGVE